MKKTLPKRDRKGRFVKKKSNILKAKTTNLRTTATICNPNTDPKKVVRAFRDVTSQNLSQREIRGLTKSGGAHLIVVELDNRNEAAYVGRVDGKGPHIFLIDPRFISEETFTHEVIHALQQYDPKRPSLDKELTIYPLSWEDVTLKEALTEAETIARVKKIDPTADNYYKDIKKDNPQYPSEKEMKKEDRKRLTGENDTPKGEKSVKIVHKKFKNLRISKFKYPKSKLTAKQQLKTKTIKRR